jgi:pimeloyl-ACP methyl ester carboxylesterase
VLIGSSLGGYIAALYAARNPARVERLVLMAPAFTFARSFPASLSTEVLASWRERGWMEVYHYGQEANCRLDIALLEDAAGYEDFPDVVVPTLIFHGRHDDVVDPALSETFAASRSNVELLLLDSNHELRDVTRTMWDHMRSFLNIP